MRATSSVSASLFRPPCRLPQNFIRYLMSYTFGKYTCRGDNHPLSRRSLLISDGADEVARAHAPTTAEKLEQPELTCFWGPKNNKTCQALIRTACFNTVCLVAHCWLAMKPCRRQGLRTHLQQLQELHPTEGARGCGP